MTIAQAGARHRIVSVEKHDGTITNGRPTYEVDADWDVIQNLRQVPVFYQGVTGGEVVRGVQVEATATALIRMLSSPRSRQIEPRMRIRLDGRKLNVISVIDREGRQRELFVQVKEDVAN